MKKTILIDASLTGGRGAAKQAYELCTAFEENDIDFKVITNRSFVPKLKELKVTPDEIIDAEFEDGNEMIYKAYKNKLIQIKFDLLVKCGARTASTYICSTLNKPFITLDGGLPDKLEEYPSLYAKEGYLKAQQYLLCTHFPWKYPQRLDINNIKVTTYPFSNKTIHFISRLRNKNKNVVRAELIDNFPEFSYSYDLIIQLLITGDFLTSPLERMTYGGWLKSTQYDETVGFIRRFFVDLQESKKKTLVIVDKPIYAIVQDIINKSSSIKISFNRKSWEYYTEIKVSQAADIIVSRATNYIPNIALLGHGGLITTPVPAHGYMDEDNAAIQAQALDLTYLINYDDERYMKKLLDFAKDSQRQKTISQNLLKVSMAMLRDWNSVNLILQAIKSL